MAEKIWNGDAGDGNVNNDGNWAPISIRNSSYQWRASGSGTGEYYLEAAGGGDPGIAEPSNVQADGSNLGSGTAGTLSGDQWDWADNDTLGFSTVYVRLSDDADPDSKVAGFVTFTDSLNDSDDVRVPDGTPAMTAGLNQSGVSLSSFRVERGAPAIGSREEFLQIKTSSFRFDGSGEAYIDLTDSSIDPEITHTASAADGRYGLHLDGSALGTLYVTGGSVKVVEGASITNVEHTGTGRVEVNGAATTLRNAGSGRITTEGSGAVSTLEAIAGTIVSNSTGAVTNARVYGSGLVDFTRSRESRNVTNMEADGNGRIVYDPNVVAAGSVPTANGPIQIARR